MASLESLSETETHLTDALTQLHAIDLRRLAGEPPAIVEAIKDTRELLDSALAVLRHRARAAEAAAAVDAVAGAADAVRRANGR